MLKTSRCVVGDDWVGKYDYLNVWHFWRTTFAELNNELGADVGGYLTRLESQFGLIAKKQPIYETVKTKNCRYQIEDCFFRFWFRFVVGSSSDTADEVHAAGLDAETTSIMR